MQSDKRSTGSWRRLWSQLALAAAGFAACNWLCYYASDYFEKEASYHEEVAHALNGPGAPAIFAGDSHVATTLQYFDDFVPGIGYSVAFGGDSYRESYAKIRYVLDHARSFDTVFITADPHMFGTARLQSSNRAFADIYFLKARDSSGLAEGWLTAIRNQVPLLNDDYIQYVRKKVGAATHARRSDGDAVEREDSGWPLLPPAQREPIARRTGLEDHAGVGEHAEPFQWLGRILDTARDRGVRVIGIRFPVSAPYRANASTTSVARIDAFMRAHGAAQIIDLRDALSDPADFIDPDHVSERGAGKALALLRARLPNEFDAHRRSAQN